MSLELRIDIFFLLSLKILILFQFILSSNSFILSPITTILLLDVNLITGDNNNNNLNNKIQLTTLSTIFTSNNNKREKYDLEMGNDTGVEKKNFTDGNIEFLCENFGNEEKCGNNFGDSIEAVEEQDNQDDINGKFKFDDDFVDNETKLELTILGLFELTQSHRDESEARPEGPSELQAAKLAIDHINNKDILPKFKINLIYNDTKVNKKIKSLKIH